MEFASCLEKQQKIREFFSAASTPEERYQIIIDLGKQAPRLPLEEKTEERRVKGCQSLTYLKADFVEGKCLFQIDSEALISAGLGQLLTRVYSGEPPEAIVKCPPHYLEELGIVKSLSPSRSQGLGNMFARMKLEAVKFFVYILAVFIGGALRNDYSQITNTISELTLANAPNKLLLDILFSFYNISLLIFGIGSYLDSNIDDSKKYKIASIFLALIGLLGLSMYFFPREFREVQLQL